MIKSKIVSIPEKMEKFYGKGTMLHPVPNDIEALIKKIPRGKVLSIDMLAKRLANDHGTDVTCPMRTGNAIKKISKRYSAENLDRDLPFWRVIRKDNLVVKTDNYEFWATQLEEEGFELSYTKAQAIKVMVDEKDLFTL